MLKNIERKKSVPNDVALALEKVVKCKDVWDGTEGKVGVASKSIAKAKEALGKFERAKNEFTVIGKKQAKSFAKDIGSSLKDLRLAFDYVDVLVPKIDPHLSQLQMIAIAALRSTTDEKKAALDKIWKKEFILLDGVAKNLTNITDSCRKLRESAFKCYIKVAKFAVPKGGVGLSERKDLPKTVKMLDMYVRAINDSNNAVMLLLTSLKKSD